MPSQPNQPHRRPLSVLCLQGSGRAPQITTATSGIKRVVNSHHGRLRVQRYVCKTLTVVMPGNTGSHTRQNLLAPAHRACYFIALTRGSYHVCKYFKLQSLRLSPTVCQTHSKTHSGCTAAATTTLDEHAADHHARLDFSRLHNREQGREHQQHQQQAVPPGYYQGYPPYPYGPYAAPQQKSGGGIPAYVWIAVGLGIAFLVNKVRLPGIDDRACVIL